MEIQRYKDEFFCKKRIVLVGVLVLIILCFFMTVKYGKNNGNGENNSIMIQNRNIIKVACVGDSITYGYGLVNWEKNNYPVILASLLGKSYQVKNFGDNGSCVQADAEQPYEMTAAYEESISFESDILIFMLGTNDSKVENWKGIEVFKEQYLKLLDSYLKGEHMPDVYLCTPAHSFSLTGSSGGVVNFEVQPEMVDQMAECVRQIAKEREYPLIDIHVLTENHPEWFKEDGIHPDENGAEAIAKEVWRVLNEKAESE